MTGLKQWWEWRYELGNEADGYHWAWIWPRTLLVVALFAAFFVAVGFALVAAGP